MFIYPVFGKWAWGSLLLENGAGWLESVGPGFCDFAGSTVVHSVGGWLALAGAIVLGPRIGKYGPDRRPSAIPGHSITLAALVALIGLIGIILPIYALEQPEEQQMVSVAAFTGLVETGDVAVVFNWNWDYTVNGTAEYPLTPASDSVFYSTCRFFHRFGWP